MKYSLQQLSRRIRRVIPGMGQPLGGYLPPGGLSMDPDAAAYIAALETAGATVSPTQSAAIDAFIVAEKAGSRWDLIKRLYLPIWELETPNAICMRSLTSGSFEGTVTHSAGFVQGDGTSGTFRTDTGPVTLGLDRIDISLFKGIYEPDTRHATGLTVRDCGNVSNQLWMSSFGAGFTGRLQGFRTGGHTQRAQIAVGRINGVFFGSSTANDLRRIGGLGNAGWTHVSNTSADSGTMSNNLITFLRNTQYADSKQFLYGFGHGMSLENMEGCSRGLLTLWETCTGLTLA